MRIFAAVFAQTPAGGDAGANEELSLRIGSNHCKNKDYRREHLHRRRNDPPDDLPRGKRLEVAING